MSRALDRRFFLKGLTAGLGVASTFFRSEVALGQTSTAPTRVLLVPIQHGWGYDRTYGALTGTEFDFVIPKPLDKLTAIKDQCVFVDGVRGTLWGNAHDVSYSDIFTASVPWGESNSAQLGRVFPEPIGPSIDHVIAKHHDRDVLRLSAGYRSWGKQSHPLCFDETARWLPSYTTPQAAFDGVIAPIRDAANPLPPSRRAIRDAFFSHLGRDTDLMLSRVSGSERAKLEEYLTAFNGLGNRLRGQVSIELSADDIPTRPSSPVPFVDTLDAYFELITLAFRADTHRVAVLGLGEGLPSYDWVGSDGIAHDGNIWLKDFHHNIAHYSPSNHGGSLDPRLAYEGWIDGYVEKIVKFAQSLDAIQDIDGRSLLDNTLVVLTGEVGNGGHDTRRKLHILIGGGGGIRRGRWVKTPDIEPRARNGFFIGGQQRDGTLVSSTINHGPPFSAAHTGDMLAAIGRLAGVPMEKFGFACNNSYRLDLT